MRLQLRLLPLVALLAAAGGSGGGRAGGAACPAHCWCADGPSIELRCALPAAPGKGEAGIEVEGRPDHYVNVRCEGVPSDAEFPCTSMPVYDFAHNSTLPSLSVSSCPLSPGTLTCVQDAMHAAGATTLSLQHVAGTLTVDGGLLAGMETVETLFLSGDEEQLPSVTIPDAALSSLPSLTSLTVNCARLTLTPLSLRSTPALRTLQLSASQLRSLPTGLLTRLPALERLQLWGNDLQNFTDDTFKGLSSLRELDLMSNSVAEVSPRWLAGAPGLRALNLANNTLRVLPPLRDLQQLQELRVFDNRVSMVISPGALSGLPALSVVDLSRSGIASLPSDTFSGSAALRTLRLSGNRLAELPRGLLHDQRGLTVLDLSNNQLVEFQGDVFRGLAALEELYLDRNNLTTLPMGLLDGLGALRVLSATHNSLRTLPAAALRGADRLEQLLLAHNQLVFYDSAAGQGTYREVSSVSPFNSLTRLRRVDLRHNRLRALFSDVGLVLLRLELLDVSHNELQELGLFNNELSFLSANLTVDARHNNIRAVHLSPAEPVSTTPSLPGASRARVLLDDNPLHCDCVLYDLATRLHGYQPLGSEPVFDVGDAKCAAPHALVGRYVRAVPLKEFACELDASECVANCSCTVRTATRALEIACDAPPRVLPAEFGAHVELTLRAQPAILAELPSAVRVLRLSGLALRKLPPGLSSLRVQTLDLTNNSLSSVSLEQLPENISLLLSGNPLACDCWHERIIRALQLHAAHINDYESVTCEDGVALGAVNTEQLCATLHAALLGGLLALLGLLIAVVAAILYRYPLEARALMFRAGLGGCCIDEDDLDEDRPYDAFLSFAHEDERFVLEHLLPGLENGPCPFRVCVHLRDWVAGEWIPAQIARSVEQSRRTIIVLSRAFLASLWGRLEFRAAHMSAVSEVRARVIVVLLEDVSGHEEMDAELRAYLRTNTYLKWGEPWFWDKLRVSLPRRKGEERSRESGLQLMRRAVKGRYHAASGVVVVGKAGGLDARLTADGKLVNVAGKTPPTLVKATEKASPTPAIEPAPACEV